MFFLSGCDGISGIIKNPLNDPIENAIAAINRSVDKVQGESEAWRNELPQLTDQLQKIGNSLEGQANADVKIILADTTNDVRGLMNDTLKAANLYGNNMIAYFGVEARCTTDFFRTRAAESLKQLANALAFWKKNKTLPPPPPHSVCNLNPNALELHQIETTGTWAIGMPPNKIVSVYGYNFRSIALPRLEIQNSNGQRLRDANLTAAYVTQYQIDLNFSGEDFHQIADGSRVVLQWPDQPDPNTISMVLIKPAKLVINSVRFNTLSPIARESFVYPTVEIKNTGGSDSGRFVIEWNPEPNAPIKSLSVQNVKPGDQQTITLPGYTYPQDGTFATNISLSTGSNNYSSQITVTPYARIPHQGSIGISGRWPKDGGNPGQYKSWDFSTTIGTNCVLDTSRGGGSFEIEHVDNSSIKYSITWPVGYDFSFGGDTIWRSFYTLSGHIDSQTQQVTARVTLKGLGGHDWPAVRGAERFNGTFTVYSKCPY